MLECEVELTQQQLDLPALQDGTATQNQENRVRRAESTKLLFAHALHN